jgi:hypothetical protein
MNNSIRPEQKTVHSQHKPLTIYRDDHRNNHDFLAKNPYTKVLDKNAPKKHKKPQHHHSVHKHHPKTKTRPKHSSTTSSPRMRNQDALSLNNNDHDDDNELENTLTDQTVDGDSNFSYDHETDNSFTFHEMAAEEYDAETDLKEQQESERLAVYPGSSVQPSSNFTPIDNITIDPNSFIIQKDAQDGSVTFKASVLFDTQQELDDYEVIVTHITG